MSLQQTKLDQLDLSQLRVLVQELKKELSVKDNEIKEVRKEFGEALSQKDKDIGKVSKDLSEAVSSKKREIDAIREDCNTQVKELHLKNEEQKQVIESHKGLISSLTT